MYINLLKFREKEIEFENFCYRKWWRIEFEVFTVLEGRGKLKSVYYNKIG